MTTTTDRNSQNLQDLDEVIGNQIALILKAQGSIEEIGSCEFEYLVESLESLTKSRNNLLLGFPPVAINNCADKFFLKPH